MLFYFVIACLAVLPVFTSKWTTVRTPVFANSSSCPFLSAEYDLDTMRAVKEAYECPYMRYTPEDIKGFSVVDPSFLFQRFNGSTIYFYGDSLSMQTYQVFVCRIFSVATLVHQETLRNHPKFSCNSQNSCIDDSNVSQSFWPVVRSRTVFRQGRNVIHVVMPDKVTTIPLQALQLTRKGDIVVANFGKRLENNSPDKLQAIYTPYETIFKELLKRGVHLFWRETTASQFDNEQRSGTWYGSKEPPGKKVCVESHQMDYAASWQSSTNAVSQPLMIKWGVPIIEVFNATFTSPPQCHMARGFDCVHYFLNSGIASYMVDIILFNIYSIK